MDGAIWSTEVGLTAAVCVLLLGASKAGIVGLGVLATPILALVLPPQTALAVMLPVMIGLDAMAVWSFRQTVRRYLLGPLLVGALPGVVVALFVFALAEAAVLALLLGLVSLAFAIVGQGRKAKAQTDPASKASAWLAGFASGLTSAIANAGTPPVHFYLMRAGVEKELFIATSVYFFAAVNLLKLPAFAGSGFFRVDTLGLSIALAPFAFLGWRAGLWVVRRVPAERFALVVRLSLALVGVMLILRNAQIL